MGEAPTGTARPPRFLRHPQRLMGVCGRNASFLILAPSGNWRKQTHEAIGQLGRIRNGRAYGLRPLNRTIQIRELPKGRKSSCVSGQTSDSWTRGS